MGVQRVYVEKRQGFNHKAKKLYDEIKTLLKIDVIADVRVFIRYDVENVGNELFEQCIPTVFSEPPIDNVFFELPEDSDYMFAVALIPGQFDQRASSCEECIQVVRSIQRPTVKTAEVIALYGALTDDDIKQIKKYIINPIESREVELCLPGTLQAEISPPKMVETLENFAELSKEELLELIMHYSLPFDIDDLSHCQEYFKSEKRNPTITEIKLLATYWSDHCRHTTFLTVIDDVKISDEAVRKSYEKYLGIRNELYKTKQKDITLMDIATIGAKYLKSKGLLDDLDESEEVNACSVKIDVNVEGKTEKWLLMFKNETHNHPTEIEPFGGASTCVGGAIRDPLSGRSYVYQAMRITGSADPTVPISKTMPGKLPQRTITTKAAEGNSHYGNQVGLAAGLVREIYHPGYVAKRMELGALVAAAPAENVVRKQPEPPDIVLLVGGKTGRDGCGGATGSSKAHTTSSLDDGGAEVQKGDALQGRKIQRLFRNPDAAKLIKRCNDFGAGGVSVAVGELAEGLLINLDAVPTKYEGLDGTELAISESQERMAVILAKDDVEKFTKFAAEENLDATPIAVVTVDRRLKMEWQGKTIVDISRDFLDTNGVKKHTKIAVDAKSTVSANCICLSGAEIKELFKKTVGSLNGGSQKGLVDRFDSTVGAGAVLVPFGGKHQKTPVQVMAAKIPVLYKETTTCSVMSYGFDPYLSEQSPYLGAYYAVVSSIAKLVASGCTTDKVRLSFQEYFERLSNVPEKWGKPFSALLGALEAQLAFNAPAIGGKDSMSGTFEDIDVPPTLVSFAVTIREIEDIISPEFKSAGNRVAYLSPEKTSDGLFELESMKNTFSMVEKLIKSGEVISAYTLEQGGIAEGLFKMAIGNGIGFKLCSDIDLAAKNYGSFILELSEKAETPKNAVLIAETIQEYVIDTGVEKISLQELEDVYDSVLESIFPVKTDVAVTEVPKIEYSERVTIVPKAKFASPKVFIPVFPGTNCEYDMASAFVYAGAEVNFGVMKNLTVRDIDDSVEMFKNAIAASQIIAIPGGSSGGDEPDGSGKFAAAFFRRQAIKDEVHKLLEERDGLMLGICNGFQILIKLGLIQHGRITDINENSPTLTFNNIGRRRSPIVRTRVSSVKSPWFMLNEVGDISSLAVSHGEGRLYANDDVLRTLIEKGQVAAQYVDFEGEPSMDIAHNPGGSALAAESVTSPCGKILGKMGHTERYSDGIFKNVKGDYDRLIFKAAVKYFK